MGGSRRRSQGFRPSLTPRRVRRAPQLIDTGTLGCGFDQTPFSTAHICAQPPVLARPGARKPRLLLSPSRSSALLSHCPRERVGGSAARQLHDTQSAAPSTAHAQQDGRAVPRPSCWKGAETAAEARSSILTAIHRLTTGRMHTGPAHPCPCRACRAARRGRGSRRQSRRRRARRPRARRQGPPPSRPSAAAPSRPRGPTGPRRRARRTARPAGPTWRRARARQPRARARPPPCARARSSQSTSRRGSAPPAAALTARQCAESFRGSLNRSLARPRLVAADKVVCTRGRLLILWQRSTRSPTAPRHYVGCTLRPGSRRRVCAGLARRRERADAAHGAALALNTLEAGARPQGAVDVMAQNQLPTGQAAWAARQRRARRGRRRRRPRAR